jgi:hypothetical protein
MIQQFSGLVLSLSGKVVTRPLGEAHFSGVGSYCQLRLVAETRDQHKRRGIATGSSIKLRDQYIFHLVHD